VILVSLIFIFLFFIFIFLFDIFHVIFKLGHLFGSNLLISLSSLLCLEAIGVILIPFKVIIVLLWLLFLLLLWFNVGWLFHVEVQEYVRHLHDLAILVYCLGFIIFILSFFCLCLWLCFFDVIFVLTLWLLLWLLALIQIIFFGAALCFFILFILFSLFSLFR